MFTQNPKWKRHYPYFSLPKMVLLMLGILQYLSFPTLGTILWWEIADILLIQVNSYFWGQMHEWTYPTKRLSKDSGPVVNLDKKDAIPWRWSGSKRRHFTASIWIKNMPGHIYFTRNLRALHDLVIFLSHTFSNSLYWHILFWWIICSHIKSYVLNNM